MVTPDNNKQYQTLINDIKVTKNVVHEFDRKRKSHQS